MKWLVCTVLLSSSAAFAEEPDFKARALLTEDLPEGTATVRVVRGTMDKPATGVTVVVTEVGTKKQQKARTDGEGRATFPKLAVGKTYVANAEVDKKTLSTEEFAMPKKGGVRLLLSSAPVALPAAKQAPAPAAMSDVPPMMRDPRRLSGQARPEGKDPAGQLTIRTVQGAFRVSEAGLTSDFPKGGTIHLVGYKAGAATEYKTATVGDDGRATFRGLDTSGTAYYALALFRRTSGTVDRLVSRSIRMPPQVGMRMMFAGAAPDSTDPAIDDLAAQHGPQPGAGNVIIRVQVSPDKQRLLETVHAVRLVAADGTETAGALATFEPSADSIRSEIVSVSAKEMGIGPGTVGVGVFRPSVNQGLDRVPLAIHRVGKDGTLEGDPLLTGVTSDRGFFVFTDLEKARGKGPVVLVATLNGKVTTSEAFKVPAKEEEGVGRAFIFDWQGAYRSARFEGVAGEGVFHARLSAGGRDYRSPPFVLGGQGASVAISVLPDIVYQAHAMGRMEDDKYWVDFQLAVTNPGQAPFGDGVELPLPKGARGIRVPDEMASRIGIGDSKMRWKGPLPPGRTEIIGQFFLDVEDGEANFDWPLPYGLAQGNMVFENIPGMRLRGLPEGVKPESRTMQDGRTYLALRKVSIAPGQRLVFGVTGLPERSGTAWFLRIAAGVTVLAFLLWAGFQAMTSNARPGIQQRRERERLMDQLVQLELRKKRARIGTGEYEVAREKLIQRLTQLAGGPS